MRTPRSKPYIKNKPAQFGIRFYAVVGWKHHYLYSFWDNGSGNHIETTQASKYCNVFKDKKTIYQNKFVKDKDSEIKHDKASPLWCLQIAQMHKNHELPGGHRVILMDNFYTRQALAKKIKSLTNDEIRLTGTVRMNLIDKLNKPLVKEACEKNQNMDTGTWLLVSK